MKLIDKIAKDYFKHLVRYLCLAGGTGGTKGKDIFEKYD